MAPEQVVLSAGLLTMLTVELVKWVLRRFVLKDPEFDFAPTLYALVLPLVTALWGVGLEYVGWGPEMGLDWQTLLQWAIAVAVSVGTYQLTLKPMKNYAKEYRADG